MREQEPPPTRVAAAVVGAEALAGTLAAALVGTLAAAQAGTLAAVLVAGIVKPLLMNKSPVVGTSALAAGKTPVLDLVLHKLLAAGRSALAVGWSLVAAKATLWLLQK